VARHPTKLGYVRYGDDSVVLVNGTKAEAEAVKRQVKTHLATMGLTLNEEKTKLTHWAKPITFLGYHIRGKVRVRGVSLKAVLHLPTAKEKRVRQELRQVASAHHIPALDAMWLLNAKFQGWCHYYRYANNPQPPFNRVAQQLWWYYAHYLARQRRVNIRKLVLWGKRTGHLKRVKKGPARRGTFVTQVGSRSTTLISSRLKR
jgi:Reverse transcriptase (RNA-dependent DNA polymerase)/Group II intron, maturase-specific domain